MKTRNHSMLVRWGLRAFIAAGALLVVVATRYGNQPGEAANVNLQDRVPLEVEHQPGILPDRIILTFAGDPATSQAVTWRTSTEATSPQAQIAKAGVNKQFAADAKTIEAKTEKFQSNLGEALYHSVVFTDLEPATKYAYRVGDGTNWSEWFDFQTASAKPAPFSFIYFGDAQNDIKEYWSRVIRRAFKEDSRANFLLHAGDLVNRANNDNEWGEWHRAGGWLNAMMPSVATPGNHEYFRDAMGRGVSRHWRPTFTMPENGPKGLEETVYYIDYQGARIISLNSMEQLEEQAKWLEGVLKDNPNKWTIITYHYPMYSPAKGRDNARLRQIWQPIFDKYGVDLVLQGHDHTYGRSGLTFGKNVPEGGQARTGNGTVYVVSVSGPKMYSLKEGEDAAWMKRSAAQKQLYQIIRVDGDKLRFEAYTVLGDTYDVFELHKQPDGGNKMLEWEELKVQLPQPKGPKRATWIALVAILAPVGLLGLIRWVRAK